MLRRPMTILWSKVAKQDYGSTLVPIWLCNVIRNLCASWNTRMQFLQSSEMRLPRPSDSKRSLPHEDVLCPLGWARAQEARALKRAGLSDLAVMQGSGYYQRDKTRWRTLYWTVREIIQRKLAIIPWHSFAASNSEGTNYFFSRSFCFVQFSAAKTNMCIEHSSTSVTRLKISWRGKKMASQLRW